MSISSVDAFFKLSELTIYKEQSKGNTGNANSWFLLIQFSDSRHDMIFQTTNQENARLGNLEIQMQTYLWELQMITAPAAGRTPPLALQVMCKCAGAVSA